MAGRPKAIIDWKKVDQMLQAACTGIEIAACLGVAPLTLYRACESENKVNFDAYSQAKRAHGDLLLKTAQFKKAVIGVHLGIFKPYLKQFEMMPKVTAEHKSESFDVLGRAFQRIVLNKESDN